MKLKDVIDKITREKLIPFLEEEIVLERKENGGIVYSFNSGEVWIAIFTGDTMFRTPNQEFRAI